MSSLLVSLTPVLTKELQEFYAVEPDLLGYSIEFDMSDDIATLAYNILENASLLGTFMLPKQFWDVLLDQAQMIYSRLLAHSSIHLSSEEEDVLCLMMVELTRRSDAEDEDGRLWDYLSQKLGWSSELEVSRQNLDNRLRDLLWRSMQRHNRYLAEYGQRYYTTLQMHALSPAWSVEHLLNILYGFYAKCLEYQYTPKDSSIPILIQNIARRWDDERLIDDVEERLRSDSLASGFRVLFQCRPHFMAAICDMILGKMDAMLTGDFSLLSQENRWDVLLLEWYNKRTDSEKRDMVDRRKNRSRNKVITHKEHICPEYYLDDEELCLRLPKLRLPEIEITHPPVMELYQGDLLIHSRTLSIFGDLCYTTREVGLCLTGQETDMNPNYPFDLVVRLRCGEEEFYSSGEQLIRDYLVFDRFGEEIKALPRGLGQVYLLTSSRAKVELPEEEDIDMSGLFGQLYILSTEAARQTFVNSHPVLPEAGTRSRPRVSFTREPEELEVLFGSKRLQVFSTPPVAKIISTERNAGKRYVVLCDNVRKQLYNYENNEENDRFLIPLPKMPNYPHSFQILDIETGKIDFTVEYMILNNFSCSFDRPYYLNRSCTGRATIRVGGNTKTSDFQLEIGQKQVSFPLWGGTYTAVVPVPRLEIFFNGENALTMRPWIWHEELRQGSFISIHCPIGVTSELVLGAQSVPSSKKGRLFELGNFLNSKAKWEMNSLPLGVFVRKNGELMEEIFLTDVLFHADFTDCPIQVDGRRITWAPENLFRGAPKSELIVLLENDQSEDPWRFRVGIQPYVLEKNFPCQDGHYSVQVLLREKKGIFAKIEERLLWEEKLKIGEPERNRWRGKELHLTVAHYKPEDGSLQTVPIQNNGAIITYPEYVGLSAPEDRTGVSPLPEYRGHLCWRTWDGRQYNFNSNYDSQNYQWINPLRFWVNEEKKRLYIQTADETSLLFSLERSPARIVNQMLDCDWQQGYYVDADFFTYEERDI